MYDPHAFLDNIDANAVPILLVCGISMTANVIAFIEAFRVSRRLKIVTMPVFCTTIWLAHDASFVGQYDKWFNGYDHWYTKLYWAGLVLTVAWELAFTWQLISYGRQEFAPFLSHRQWIGAVFGAIALATCGWLTIKAYLSDDLYAWSFAVALLPYPVFGLFTMAKRRSVRGFTPLQPAMVTLMGLAYFVASIGWFGPAFHTWQWFMLAVVTTSASAFMTWCAVRFREPDGAQVTSRVPDSEVQLAG